MVCKVIARLLSKPDPDTGFRFGDVDRKLLVLGQKMFYDAYVAVGL